MADEPANAPYVVELTGIAREQLREIARRAARSFEGAAVVDAYERILMRLAADARAVGDPIYRLRRIKMDVLHFVDSPLYVQYGIPNGRRLAVIRRFVRVTAVPG